MKIKEVKAKSLRDSRDEKTIQIVIKTSAGNFETSSPSGKSKGEHEMPSYSKDLQGDIEIINHLDIEEIEDILGNRIVDNADSAFDFLADFERFIDNKIGANTLFAFESCFLKAFARENKKELWEFLLGDKKIKFPRSVGNAVGGGLHSRGKRGKKPDFQEFLFIADEDSFADSVKLNELAYKIIGKEMGFFRRRNDEGAWETGKSNEEVLEIMKKIQDEIKKKYDKKMDIGLDVAASSFYKKGFYEYKNFHKELDRNSQINYISKIAKKYGIFYIEDGLEENDFDGFAEIIFEVRKNNSLVVGDDLTVTNPYRLEKAVRLKSINAIIIKPNQIGSLLKLKKAIDIAKKNNIKTIISHRSGETMDNTIADLCIGFQCDFIKTGIYGDIRKVKLNRIIGIEKKTKK